MFRTVSRTCLFAAMLAIAPLALSACDDDEPVTPPTAPDPVTEILTGSITRNGAESKPFTVSAGGTVTATLKTIGTDNTLVVGFSLGEWIANACLIRYANDAATGGAVLSAAMPSAGTLCVRVYDVGNVAGGEPVPYSVEVVHP